MTYPIQQFVQFVLHFETIQDVHEAIRQKPQWYDLMKAYEWMFYALETSNYKIMFVWFFLLKT